MKRGYDAEDADADANEAITQKIPNPTFDQPKTEVDQTGRLKTSRSINGRTYEMCLPARHRRTESQFFGVSETSSGEWIAKWGSGPNTSKRSKTWTEEGAALYRDKELRAAGLQLDFPMNFPIDSDEEAVKSRWTSDEMQKKSSTFRGVYARGTAGRFSAAIWIKNRRHYLGTFKSEEEAARKYDEKARDVGQTHVGLLNFKMSSLDEVLSHAYDEFETPEALSDWGKSLCSFKALVPASVWGVQYSQDSLKRWGVKSRLSSVISFVRGAETRLHRWHFLWKDPDQAEIGVVDFKTLRSYLRAAAESQPLEGPE